MEARYAKLSDLLTRQIAEGFYPVGDYLPSEQKLAEEFAVSRPTVRRALDHLAEIGLITRRRGDGTRVLASRPFADYSYTTKPVDDLLYGRGAERVVTSIESIVADTELAVQLDGQPGKRWLRVRQHRSDQSNGDMLVWGNVYIDWQFRNVADQIADYPGFICDLIEETHGIAVSEIQQQLRAVIIPPDVCQEMRLPDQSLGLEMTRRYLNSQKKPVEITINIFPEMRSAFQFTLKRTRQGGLGK